MSSEGNGAEFDLHSAVRNVITTSGLNDPRDIAAKVAENVPAKHLRRALQLTLVAFVREEFRQQRAPAAPAVSVRNSARSSKVRAVREDWRRVLAGRFHVGGQVWKPLAQCSYEQVVFLAAERRRNAEKVLAVAGMFEALAEAMRKHEVSVVAQLPEPVLADVLTVAAAA